MNKNLKVRNGNNDFFEGFMKVEPFQVASIPIGVLYKVTIDEEIECVRQFQDLVAVLDGASDSDCVEIRLTTPGGSLAAITPLLNAMENTNASVFVHVISDVASAGTLIMMAADNVYVNPYSQLVFHQSSFGLYSVSSTVEAAVTHTLKSTRELIRNSYKYFFTEEELKSMLSGVEYFLNKEEFDERYARRNAAITAEIEAAKSVAPPEMKKPRTKKTNPVQLSE